jgi:5-methyltetrahydrofolate--homocysteine methyltransferase
MVAAKLERFCDEGWLNIVGGCCGTTAEHIRLISQMAAGKKPRRFSGARRSSIAGLESFVVDADKRPVLVGERTNVIGSRVFKDLIVQEKFEEASEIGRRQARHGAQVLDVCLANPDRDENAGAGAAAARSSGSHGPRADVYAAIDIGSQHGQRRGSDDAVPAPQGY